MNRTYYLAAGGGFGTSAVAAGIDEPIGILDATLWIVDISGQEAAVTGQSLVVICGAIVGVGALLVSIIRVWRGG